jgi:peptidoglycan/LPS O-acetylase OafA/YrhL
MKKTVYFENLDGLRFFCFLSVFLFHSFHTNVAAIKSDSLYQFVKNDLFGNGNLGVNFFFVLSGFLITYLLIEEKHLNGQIDILRFWVRRVLRIWPLFYLCVFLGFVAFPFLKSYFGQVPNENASLWHYLFFVNNFDLIQKGLPDSSILSVLWSIAVEEQFYFAWPILLYVLPVKRYWIAFTVIILGSLIFRAVYDVYESHEWSTFSCMGDLAIGATGAWLVQQYPLFKSYFETLTRWEILSAYVLLILVYFFRDEVLLSTHAIRIFERFFISIVMLFVILEQNYAKNSWFKFSRAGLISKLGVITYGLYSLQFVGILVTTTFTQRFHLNTQRWQVLVLETTVALLATIVMGVISFRFFEKPFLNLKTRFSYITKSNAQTFQE